MTDSDHRGSQAAVLVICYAWSLNVCTLCSIWLEYYHCENGIERQTAKAISSLIDHSGCKQPHQLLELIEKIAQLFTCLE